jgi:hypothetical protein
VYIFSVLNIKKVGNRWVIDVISTILDRNKPIPTPNKVDAVNYDTLLPDISPILFLFAN